MIRFCRTRLFLLAAALPVLAGCHGGAATGAAGEAAAPPRVRVDVVKPLRTTIRQTIEQPGQIRAFEETPLFAKVAGYVQRMAVDLGDPVRGPRPDPQGGQSPGQILAELWIPEAADEVRQKQAALAQARAGVEQAQAAIRLAEAGVVSAEAAATQAVAAVKRADAQLERWRSETERFVRLAQQAAVTEKLVVETRQQRDAAEADREEAVAKRVAAQAAIAEKKALVDKARADLGAAQAHVGAAQSDCQRAETLLAYAAIRAPFDGIVTRRNADTGWFVQPGAQALPLLVVVRTDRLRLQVDLPEADASVLQPGAPVSVRLPALAGAALELTIARVAGSLDGTSRTLRVEADIDNANGKLRPGMYAQATIVVAQRPDVLVLPLSAVVFDKEPWCAAVESGKVVRRPVVLGLREKSAVQVASGLAGDEAVIRGNPAAFAVGQEVHPVESPAPSKSP